MAFSGKSGDLTFTQILSLLHTSDSEILLEIRTENTLWCLKSVDGKLVSIGADPLDEDIESILITRGLLKVSTLKEIDDQEVKEKGLEQVLLEKEVITSKQADLAVFHLAEAAFYELIREASGSFKIIESPDIKLYPFCDKFRQFLSESYTDLGYLTGFRANFSDFDARLFWISPSKNSALPKEMTLKEIQILSRYRPSITIRSFWESFDGPLKPVSESLKTLSEKDILNINPPGSAKIPNAKPFLRILLSRVVDQLFEAQDLLGKTGELNDVLNSINENLVKMPEFTAAAAMKSEGLGDLSGLTGSLDGLLDLNGVEELDLQQEIEQGKPEPEKKKAGKQKKPVSSGVRRQPVKQTAAPAEQNAEDDGVILRKMNPDPKRKEEVQRLIEASKAFDTDGVSLEEKVDAKVRYRQFNSEVNMSFNRFTMTRQTLFEVFGLTPNANKKAIHKAFVKTINSINPKGISFKSFDRDALERAIFLRDQYKKIYITLMDEKKKRAYVDTLRSERQEKETNKIKAMKLFNEGMARVRAGKFNEAREIFRRAAKFDPNSPVYYTVMEDIDKEEREGNAVKFFQAGILAFKQKNDYERAIKLIRKALTLRPLDPTYHLKLAEIQAMSKDYRDDAIDSYIKALDLDPGNQDLRLLIANFLRTLNRKQEAANMYRDILKWNPDHSVVKKAMQELLKEGIKPDKEETVDTKEKSELSVNEEFE